MISFGFQDENVNFYICSQTTLLFTVNGQCYTCGSNQFGQLGDDVERSGRQPRHVKALQPYKITKVACGDTYTVAVSEGLCKLLIISKPKTIARGLCILFFYLY